VATAPNPFVCLLKSASNVCKLYIKGAQLVGQIIDAFVYWLGRIRDYWGKYPHW